MKSLGVQDTSEEVASFAASDASLTNEASSFPYYPHSTYQRALPYFEAQ